MQSSNRYPSVRHFETADKDIFFGRDKDVEDLYQIINLEKIVVVFGKSGYGKSSLLNAGIIPKLEEKANRNNKESVSLTIRFRPYDEKTKYSPVEILLKKLFPSLSQSLQSANVLDDKNVESQGLTWVQLNDEKNLWFYFKMQEYQSPKEYVLVFDQFEE